MSTTIVQEQRVNTSSGDTSATTHVISLTGRAGIMFWSLMVGAMLFLVGFSTPGWVIYQGNHHIGLWEHCVCEGPLDKSYIKGTQAMEILALLTMVVAMVSSTIYMFLHKPTFSKDFAVKVIMLSTLLTTLLLFLAVIIFGSNSELTSFSYSFAFTILAMILNLLSCGAAVLQWWTSRASRTSS